MIALAPSMSKSEQTALIMSILIQIGRTLDDIGETDAAIMVAETCVFMASNRKPNSDQEREDLEKIRDGLSTIVNMMKHKKENKPTLQ